MEKNVIEEIDIQNYLNGIKSDLQKVKLDLDSRILIDKLAEALDELCSQNKNTNSSSFNRIMLQHVLDFKNLNREADVPILVSEFFNSYFLCYESMRKNKEMHGKNCLNLTEKISAYKVEVNKEKETETLFDNGQTSNSKLKIEVKDIQIFQDLSETNLEKVFKGKSIILEYDEDSDLKGETPKGDKFVLKEILLNADALHNSYQIGVSDINKSISIVLCSQKELIKLDDFYPRDYMDTVVEKVVNVPSIGEITFDIAYINSKVMFISKIIIEHEKEYEYNHVIFDELDYSIGLLEDPFKNFFDRLNSDPERALHSEVDPNKRAYINKESQSYVSNFQRNQIEASEKIESLLLSASGRKNIVWDTIYFLFNKIMLVCLVFVMSYRPDYASLIIGLVGLGFETRNLKNSKFSTLVFFLFLSLLFDLFWVLGNLIDWGETTPLEGKKTNNIRKFSTFVSLIVLFLKVVLCFSGWRLSIIYKMKEVNLLNLPGKSAPKRTVVRAQVKEEKKDKKSKRPVISYNREQISNTSLRFLDGGL